MYYITHFFQYSISWVFVKYKVYHITTFYLIFIVSIRRRKEEKREEKKKRKKKREKEKEK